MAICVVQPHYIVHGGVMLLRLAMFRNLQFVWGVAAEHYTITILTGGDLGVG